ncbi:hypothetical protein CVT25_012148 [Psilocybe cyanescens]|uniref:Uncharacterized protein n=1 Tax=Psilocybe cyanescens TaxID=93625 RepID=A0A409XH52_PSICY|nr:hypothetical protein CVT25_012148 [Psilocybe cyanescens]
MGDAHERALVCQRKACAHILPSSSLRIKNTTSATAVSLDDDAAPVAELEVVLQPLRPAWSRMGVRAKLVHENASLEAKIDVVDELLHPRAPSSLTFGSDLQSRGSGRGSMRMSDEFSGSLMLVFQRIQGYKTLCRPSPSSSPKSVNARAHVNLGTRRASRSSKGSRSSYRSQITSHLSYTDAHTNNEELPYVATHDEDQEQEHQTQMQTAYSIPISRATRMCLYITMRSWMRRMRTRMC